MPGATDLCFICGWWFKTPNLKMPGKVQTHSSPLEESLTVRLAPFCPGKGVAQCAGGLESIVVNSEKLRPGNPCPLLLISR